MRLTAVGQHFLAWLLSCHAASVKGAERLQAASHRSKTTPKKRRLRPASQPHGLPEVCEDCPGDGMAGAGVLRRALNPQSMMSLLEGGEMQARPSPASLASLVSYSSHHAGCARGSNRTLLP